MKVPVNDVLSAEVRFELIGAEPDTPERPILTMLEVRYVLGGTVCGTACRTIGRREARSRREATSQTFTTPSSLPVTKLRPFGVKATRLRRAWWPRSRASVR